MKKRIENQLQIVPDVAMATNPKISIILFLSLLLNLSIMYCKCIWVMSICVYEYMSI